MGEISPQELKTALKQAETNINDDEVMKIFSDIDVNKSGGIN